MNGAFSETLSRLRQTKGVSQRVAAGELGVSQALLSHYENGIREPGLEFVCRACDYYGVSSDQLLGRTGDGEAEDGSGSGSIQLRLMADSGGVVSDLLERLGSQDIQDRAWDCISVMYLRLLMVLEPDQTAALAGTDRETLELKSSAALAMAELELRRAARRCPGDKLDQGFSDDRDTLTQMLYSAVDRLNRL